MKTKIPESINSLEEAYCFLKDLVDNAEIWHPDDDATDVIWDGTDEPPTPEEAAMLNKLMDEVRDYDPDPCCFIMKYCESL